MLDVKTVKLYCKYTRLKRLCIESTNIHEGCMSLNCHLFWQSKQTCICNQWFFWAVIFQCHIHVLHHTEAQQGLSDLVTFRAASQMCHWKNGLPHAIRGTLDKLKMIEVNFRELCEQVLSFRIRLIFSPWVYLIKVIQQLKVWQFLTGRGYI